MFQILTYWLCFFWSWLFELRCQVLDLVMCQLLQDLQANTLGKWTNHSTVERRDFLSMSMSWTAPWSPTVGSRNSIDFDPAGSPVTHPIAEVRPILEHHSWWGRVQLGLRWGWWFQTLFIFIYGMSSFPVTNSIIFQDGYCTTNQIQTYYYWFNHH